MYVRRTRLRRPVAASRRQTLLPRVGQEDAVSRRPSATSHATAMPRPSHDAAAASASPSFPLLSPVPMGALAALLSCCCAATRAACRRSRTTLKYDETQLEHAREREVVCVDRTRPVRVGPDLVRPTSSHHRRSLMHCLPLSSFFTDSHTRLMTTASSVPRNDADDGQEASHPATTTSSSLERTSRVSSARWYARQAARKVLVPDDMTHLSNPSLFLGKDRSEAAPSSRPHPASAAVGSGAGSLTRRHIAVNSFLGFASLPASSGADLLSLFAALPVDAQADTIACLSRRADQTRPLATQDVIPTFLLHVATLDGTVHDDEGVAEACLTVVKVIDPDMCPALNKQHLLSLFRHVLRSTGVWGSDGGSTDDGKTAWAPSIAANLAECDGIVRHVLKLGEAAKLHEGETVREWCHILHRDAGLPYEASAYWCCSEREVPHGTWGESVRRASPFGFGEQVCTFLRSVPQRFTSPGAAAAVASRQFPAALEELCVGMPPCLRTSTINLCVASFIRARQESIGTAQDSSGLTLLPGNCFATGMTALQFVSHVHFVLRVGNRQSASELLPQSRTRQQVVATMLYTQNAGCDTSLAAAKRLLEVRPSEKIFVVLRFGEARERAKGVACEPRKRQRTALVFQLAAKDINLGTVYTRQSEDGASRGTESSHRSSSPSCDELHPASLGGVPRRHFHVLRAALESAASGPLVGGSRPLEAVLRGVTAAAVPLVARSMGVHFTADVAAWWAALLVEDGRMGSAMAVLRTAQGGGLYPDMGVLVLLLEKSVPSEVALREAVDFVATEYAAVKDTVFRAFVERAASRSTAAADGSRCSPRAALDLMASFAILGLPHYPLSWLETIALEAPTPMVGTMVRLIRHQRAGTQPHKGTASAPVILHVDAVRRLAAAVAELELSPEADVYTSCSVSRSVSWWASASWRTPRSPAPHHAPVPPGRSATEHVYRTGAVALWPVVLQELSWGVQGKAAAVPHTAFVHKALRVIAVGCGDGKQVVRLFDKYRPFLVQRPTGSLAKGRGRHRSTTRDDMMLLHTIAFMAEVLSRKGFWEEALQLFPNAKVSSLPHALKVARLRVIRHNPDFRLFGALTLASEERAAIRESAAAWACERRRRWRHQPHLRRRRCLTPRQAHPRASGDDGSSPDALARCVRYPAPLTRLLELLWPPSPGSDGEASTGGRRKED